MMVEDEAAGALSLSVDFVINAGMRTRSHSLTQHKDRVREGREGAGEMAWMGTRPRPLYIHQHIIVRVRAVRMHALTLTIHSLSLFRLLSVPLKRFLIKESQNVSFAQEMTKKVLGTAIQFKSYDKFHWL